MYLPTFGVRLSSLVGGPNHMALGEFLGRRQVTNGDCSIFTIEPLPTRGIRFNLSKNESLFERFAEKT